MWPILSCWQLAVLPCTLWCLGTAWGRKLYCLPITGTVGFFGAQGFGEGCAPKGQCTFGPRLSDDVIAQLADYVLQNAEEGWQTLS